MPKRRDWRERLTSLLDLPGDVIRDLARVTLVGDMQLAVENHRGLVGYASDRVVLKTPSGILAVTGSDLVISQITPEAILLSGRVTGLAFLDAGSPPGQA